MIRRTVLALTAVVVMVPLLGGCGNDPNKVPAHTADERKIIDQLENETPEQKIERIQKGPMPASAKEAMIKKIKDEHGIK